MKCCVNCCLNVEDPPPPQEFEHLVYPWCCQGSLLALLEVKPHRRRKSAPEGGDFVAQSFFLFPLCFLTLHMNGLQCEQWPPDTMSSPSWWAISPQTGSQTQPLPPSNYFLHDVPARRKVTNPSGICLVAMGTPTTLQYPTSHLKEVNQSEFELRSDHQISFFVPSEVEWAGYLNGWEGISTVGLFPKQREGDEGETSIDIII